MLQQLSFCANSGFALLCFVPINIISAVLLCLFVCVCVCGDSSFLLLGGHKNNTALRMAIFLIAEEHKIGEINENFTFLLLMPASVQLHSLIPHPLQKNKKLQLVLNLCYETCWFGKTSMYKGTCSPTRDACKKLPLERPWIGLGKVQSGLMATDWSPTSLIPLPSGSPILKTHWCKVSSSAPPPRFPRPLEVAYCTMNHV